MPLSPCCQRKYRKPCKCYSPCNKCECTVQTGQCPPPPTTDEDEEGQVQLYTPVIAATPVTNKCCCCCCEVKPKKSLWQQLFGDKFCESGQKKKGEQKNKQQRCLPQCTNTLCCNATRPSSQPAPKPYRSSCCCKKVKSCRCKTSYDPSSPKPGSIFGCRFYCNVGNQGNQTKPPRCRCCSCCKKNQRRNFCETTNDYNDNLVETRRTLPNSESDFKKLSEKNKQNIDTPTPSNIRIGLTFTNTQTKYYKNNSCVCPRVEEERIGYSSNEDKGLSDSSEQIITLEIDQSDEKLDQGKYKVHENGQIRGEGSTSNRRKITSLQEENEKHVKASESYSREIYPPKEKKGRESKNINENTRTGSGSLAKERLKRTSKNNPGRAEDYDIDNRISEILRKLGNIENKINKIDTVNTEKKKDDNYNYRPSNNGTSPSDREDVIEIRKTRSKSYSPDRKHSSTELSSYRYSRSLDRGSTQLNKPKLIIKIPHGNKISQGYVSVSGSQRTKRLSQDHPGSEWLEVSNQLKRRKKEPCYCYECVCKRVRCR